MRKKTCSPRRHWLYYSLSVGILSLPGLCFGAPAVGGEKAKRKPDDAAKMVEAIANRNKPPKIVSRRAILPQRFPLYPKDYDWIEEERVRKALDKLCQNDSEKLWEALVRKANDESYCVVEYSDNSSDASITFVCGICHVLAYQRLCCVFEQHLPSVPPHGCPIQLESIQDDLLAWRKARKGKSLYKLQIEVCEMALRELPKQRDVDVSSKEKKEARKKIEAEIAKLRSTKRPFHEKHGDESCWGAYPRREAERVREAYEKGTLEKFQSGLNK